jgi:hypothetical protein
MCPELRGPVIRRTPFALRWTSLALKGSGSTIICPQNMERLRLGTRLSCHLVGGARSGSLPQTLAHSRLPLASP